jgi:hypothetical protein
MIDDDFYLDRVQLAARGWTRMLLDRFFPNPDRWVSVNHWKNFTGKAAYHIENVIAAEQLPEFTDAFASSVRRRCLSRHQVRGIMRERARVDARYYVASKTLSRTTNSDPAEL